MSWATQRTCDECVQRHIAGGDFRQALAELVRGYQQAMVGFCTNMLGEADHGQEVAQEVFLAAYRAMPAFRQQASVRTWLFAIARKQCLKALRDQRRRRRITEAQQQAIAAQVHREALGSPEEAPEAQMQLVKSCLMELSQDARALLMMRYDMALSLLDIAQVLGTSEASVRRRLARALQRLREVMER